MPCVDRWYWGGKRAGAGGRGAKNWIGKAARARDSKRLTLSICGTTTPKAICMSDYVCSIGAQLNWIGRVINFLSNLVISSIRFRIKSTGPRAPRNASLNKQQQCTRATATRYYCCVLRIRVMRENKANACRVNMIWKFAQRGLYLSIT